MSLYTPLITEVAELVRERALGTVGVDIFIGELPQDVTEGFFLVSAPSPAPHQYLDTEYTVIDFWYRTSHTAKGYEKMEQLKNAFHRRENYQTANWYIYFSEVLGSISDVDRDKEGGKLLRLSIQFICRNLNGIS